MNNRLHIRCDVIYPESGEVLAELGDILNAQTSRAEHVLAVAEAHTDYYTVVRGADNIIIASKPAEYDDVANALEMLGVLDLIGCETAGGENVLFGNK